VEDLLQGAAPVQHISATACDEIGTEDNEPKPSSGDLGLGSQGAHRGHKRKRPTSGDSGLPGVFDLNVGGIVFQTRRETLRNSPTLRTIIDGMAEGQPVDVDENGRLFVDRNPHTFEVILRVLQGYDRVGLDCCTMLGPLHDDADFFGVTQREVYVTRDGVEGIVTFKEAIRLAKQASLSGGHSRPNSGLGSKPHRARAPGTKDRDAKVSEPKRDRPESNHRENANSDSAQTRSPSRVNITAKSGVPSTANSFEDRLQQAGWGLLHSKENGKPYYFNLSTHETRWDPPIYPDDGPPTDMEDQWFYIAPDESVSGPHSLADMQEMIRRQALRLEDHVRRGPTGAFSEAMMCPALVFPDKPPPAPPQPIQSVGGSIACGQRTLHSHSNSWGTNHSQQMPNQSPQMQLDAVHLSGTRMGTQNVAMGVQQASNIGVQQTTQGFPKIGMVGLAPRMAGGVTVPVRVSSGEWWSDSSSLRLMPSPPVSGPHMAGASIGIPGVNNFMNPRSPMGGPGLGNGGQWRQ